MKTSIKEIIWPIFTLFTALLLYHSIFGIKNLFREIDINIHDTYFVLASYIVLIPIIVVFFSFIYFLRVIVEKFQNNTVNLVFLVSNLCLIIILSFLITIVNSFAIFPGQIIYPPLSALPVEQNGNGFDTVYYIMLTLQIFIILIEIIFSFLIGRKYNKHCV